MTTYAEAEANGTEPPTIVKGSTVWTGVPKTFEEPLEFGERERRDLLNADGPTTPQGYRYRLTAIENYASAAQPRDLIEILPVPAIDLFVTAIYLPQLDLEPQGGENPEVWYAGMKGIAEEWLILDALIVLKGKTDEQTALWERRKLEVEAELLNAAGQRDAGQPKRIRQVWHRTRTGLPAGRPPWLRGGR